MRKSFKYCLRPTKKQARLLQFMLDECRWLYNECLEQRILSYQELGQTLNLVDQHAMLPFLKEERPPLDNVHSQVLQHVIKRLDLAFQAFFRRCKKGETPGFPRFRGMHRYDSFCYPQSGFSLDGGCLKLSKIGRIRIKLHRPVEGIIKTCTIRRCPSGKWFASLSCEVDAKLLPSTDRAIAIDVGLERFATLSDGRCVENPRFFKEEEKNLAKAQRKLSRLEKGTPERRKQGKALAQIHERIRNKRSNFCHKLSRKIVNEYQYICLEELKIKKMLQGSYLAKNIIDASWSQFRSVLTYKAEEAGRKLGLVNPAYTSQICSQCGHREGKTLSDRTHHCMHCGYIAHRDFNAALNILALGLDGLGTNLRSLRVYARE